MLTTESPFPDPFEGLPFAPTLAYWFLEFGEAFLRELLAQLANPSQEFIDEAVRELNLDDVDRECLEKDLDQSGRVGAFGARNWQKWIFLTLPISSWKPPLASL